MKTLVAFAATMFSALPLVVFASPAGASSPSIDGWGNPWGKPQPTAIGTTPTTIPSPPGTIQQIASSNSNLYVLDTNGTVWAFGQGQFGQLGHGDEGRANATSFVQVKFPTGVTIASLPAIGPYNSMTAIDTGGNVWGWGYNSAGQLCLGSTAQQNRPVKLPLSDVTQTIGAGDHNLYVSNGKLYACGNQAYGSLGDGETTAAVVSHPTAVVGLPDESVKALTSSWNDGGALMADGTFWDWGYGSKGDLGNGQTDDSGTPVEVPGTWASVFEGGDRSYDGQTLAIDTSGHVWGWGADGYGQLCNGAQIKKVTTPTEITPPVPWVQVYSGGAVSFGVDGSGNLWSCGQNDAGQTGTGSTDKVVVTPQEILSGVTQMTVTAQVAAALTG